MEPSQIVQIRWRSLDSNEERSLWSETVKLLGTEMMKLLCDEKESREKLLSNQKEFLNGELELVRHRWNRVPQKKQREKPWLGGVSWRRTWKPWIAFG